MLTRQLQPAALLLCRLPLIPEGTLRQQTPPPQPRSWHDKWGAGWGVSGSVAQQLLSTRADWLCYRLPPSHLLPQPPPYGHDPRTRAIEAGSQG